jgi:hypothetical protein
MRSLSAQQRDIMVHLYHQSQAADPAPGEQGVMPWNTDGDPVFRASTSRSLRRLESRGLGSSACTTRLAEPGSLDQAGSQARPPITARRM